LITGQGVVFGRATSTLRSVETYPLIGRFVYPLLRRHVLQTLVLYASNIPPPYLLRPSLDDVDSLGPTIGRNRRSSPSTVRRRTVEPPLSLLHLVGFGLGFVRRLGLGLPLRFRLRLRLRRRTRRRPTISLLPAAPTRPLPARRFSAILRFSDSPILTRPPVDVADAPDTPPIHRPSVVIHPRIPSYIDLSSLFFFRPSVADFFNTRK
jgi:hypothetical protein